MPVFTSLMHSLVLEGAAVHTLEVCPAALLTGALAGRRLTDEHHLASDDVHTSTTPGIDVLAFTMPVWPAVPFVIPATVPLSSYQPSPTAVPGHGAGSAPHVLYECIRGDRRRRRRRADASKTRGPRHHREARGPA